MWCIRTTHCSAVRAAVAFPLGSGKSPGVVVGGGQGYLVELLVKKMHAQHAWGYAEEREQ